MSLQLIYFVNLNPVQGREQAGQRPVLVLSIDAINQPLDGNRFPPTPAGRVTGRVLEQIESTVRYCLGL